jgi:hypothetical protein
MKIFSLILLFFTLSSSYVHSAFRSNLDDSGLVATVDSWSIPASSFDIYYQYQSAQDEHLTKSALLRNVLTNRLLSGHALNTVGGELLNDDSEVAYSSDVATTDLFTSMVKSYFNKAISQQIKTSKLSSLESYITKPFKLTKKQLSEIVSKPKKSFLLVYKLDAKQIIKAKSTVLIAYRFPNLKEEVISLWEVYQAGNIQEKMSIHHLDLEKLHALIQRYMTSSYTQYWLANHSGLSQLEIQALHDFIVQNRTTGQFYRYSGFKAGIHDDNTALKKLTQQVSQTEIDQYYQKNKAQFSTVIKVKARHITLDSQALADETHTALKNGLGFSAAVAKYSISDDKNSEAPGSLGWIKREGNNDWLSSIPFTQTEGHFSPAFMSPMAPGKSRTWEIVYVDQKVEGYYPVGSETVRYIAANEIATLKIHQSMLDLRAKLLSTAEIHVAAEYSLILENEMMQTNDIDLFEQEHDHDHEAH